jgi:hypothetical protein
MASASQARKQRAWLEAKDTTREATSRFQQALDALVEARVDEENKRLAMLGASAPGADKG